MRLQLRTRVELDGAVFYFGTADRELLELVEVSKDLVDNPSMKLAELPVEVVEGFCRFFLAAIRGWENIVDENGAPIEFTPTNARDIPTELKLRLVMQYFTQLAELEEKKD